MLALSFFALIFSSLLWVIYAVMHIMDTIGASGFQTAGIVDVSIYTAFVLLPIFASWIIFGIVSQYLHNYRFNRSLHGLFVQMKKNQDYSDLMARIMLENEQQIRDGVILQQFDLFISDMNELISEIIHRSSLASVEQIDRLWSKVRNGGKWSFGKVVIEVNQNQPTFQVRIFEKSQRDIVLAGTIMEFCARYQSIVELFEKHDKEKVFLNIIETGVLGKVFSIFAPISDELKRKREASQSFSAVKVEPRYETPMASPIKQTSSPVSAQPEYSRPAPRMEEPEVEIPEKTSGGKFGFAKKIPLFKKKTSEMEEEYVDYRKPEIEKDSFSQALERSFGSEETSEPTFSSDYSQSFSAIDPEPEFHISSEPNLHNSDLYVEPKSSFSEREMPKVSVTEEIPAISNTQRTLESLKKEWENMRTPQVSTPNRNEPSVEQKSDEAENAFSSPFRGWVDEENYHK